MNNQTAIEKALVLGATGGIGGEVTQQLLAVGWQLNALKRGNLQKKDLDAASNNLNWFQGDALNQADIERAAEDCDVIVHAVNPPGYKQWNTLVLPMLDNTIAVAQKIGACIVLPGTIYNYGPDAFPVLRENSPQNPHTNKGRIRVELERRLRQFADNGGQVIIVRAGDFFGPRAGNNWFSQGLIKPNAAIKSISNPAKSMTGHQWAYLPDVATIMVKLISKRGELEPFSTFHMNGFWDKDGAQMTKAIQHVVKNATGETPKIKRFPWWFLFLISPFQETLRELLAMKYLWQNTIRMDNTKLVQFLGEEPYTPIHIAIESTLKELKCLD